VLKWLREESALLARGVKVLVLIMLMLVVVVCMFVSGFRNSSHEPLIIIINI
jgi:hypothetical protein